MSSSTLKKRKTPNGSVVEQPGDTSAAEIAGHKHPAGDAKHGTVVEVLRMLLFTLWFLFTCLCIGVTQLIGAPLYFWNKDYYYAYMALTKQSFGVVATTITQWFSPTLVRVSWDASMRGQLHRNSAGMLETEFPERLVLIANHQIYTDWLYLWWIAYTSQMHGHIFIILKESLKYIPVLGTGMMFYGFIFMSRKWTSDKPRLQHRLEKLKRRHAASTSGAAGFDPMWLLIYPEGTNLSANTRKTNRAYADKMGIEDMKYQLLPRSTGLLFCLQQLHGTVDWVYDCTVAYEGTPKGGYAQDYYGLRSTYFQGRPPASVNMYWRRFAVSSIPLDDPKAFESWIMQRWREKDHLLEQYQQTGRFPADRVESLDKDASDGYIETHVVLRKWFEIGQIFVVLAAFAMVANVVAQLWSMFFKRA